ncbi:unnamed protein product [Boreogadus saida]
MVVGITPSLGINSRDLAEPDKPECQFVSDTFRPPVAEKPYCMKNPPDTRSQEGGLEGWGRWPGGERLRRASVLVRVGTAGGLPNTCSISGEQ